MNNFTVNWKEVKCFGQEVINEKFWMLNLLSMGNYLVFIVGGRK